MLFNSFHFLAFLSVVILAMAILRGRYVKYLLLVASYYFYAGWNPNYLPLLFATTLVDHYACTALFNTECQSRRRRLVLLSVCVNIGLLSYFKYGSFLWENILRPVGELWGITISESVEIVLPVGISFYTFQSMGHTVDVYRRRFTERIGLLDFALYVSFFPQLVAGPILRGADFFPQIVGKWGNRTREWYPAINLILVGFLKKVLIADNLAPYVDAVYGDMGQYSWLEIGVATYAFAVQIYCDFSGYTDIARGVAKMIGVDIDVNFNYPYFSESMVEFWRRWHMSLSSWLRDYLYIPLGGNRAGIRTTYRNLLITMVLGGFWHGADWQFILWGAYHGLLLVVGHSIRGRQEYGEVERTLRILLTFHLVVLGWFIFRIENLTDVAAFSGSAWESPLVQSSGPLAVTLLVMAGFVCAHAWRHVARFDILAQEQPFVLQVGIVTLSVLLVVLFGAPSASFLYFQF